VRFKLIRLPYWLMLTPKFIFQFIALEHADPFASSSCYLMIKQFGSLMAGKPKRMSQLKQLRTFLKNARCQYITGAWLLSIQYNTYSFIYFVQFYWKDSEVSMLRLK